MLEKNYKCECCKKNVKQLEWDKVRRQWNCFECSDKLLKEEKNGNKK